MSEKSDIDFVPIFIILAIIIICSSIVSVSIANWFYGQGMKNYAESHNAFEFQGEWYRVEKVKP